jgi:hypothetical protein
MNKILRASLALILVAGQVFAGPATPKYVVTDYDLDSLTEVFVATNNVGVAAGSGAFAASTYSRFTVFVYVTQSDATGGISARILCRTTGDSEWLQYYPELTPGTVTPTYVNIATTGGWGREIEGPYYQCRVGMFIVTADPSDAGSNIEKVRVTVAGWN